MKYQSHIESSYAKFGYTPRGSQIATINNVLTEFLDNECSTVVLNADTGTGKSIIGAVVADVLCAITQAENCTNKAFMVVHNNNLVDQYKETLGEHCLIVKGKANYYCPLLQSTADKCISSAKHTFPQCMDCEYSKMKQNIGTANIVVTNYSWIYTTLVTRQEYNNRLVHIFDEAHTINESWCSYATMTMDKKKFQDLTSNLVDMLEARQLIDTLNLLGVQAETATMHTAQDLMTAYNNVSIVEIENHLMKLLGNNPKAHATKINKLRNFVQTVHSDREAIRMYFTGVPMSLCLQKHIELKPIFIGSYFDTVSAPYTLLMTATISEQFVNTSLQTAGKIGYVKADMAFNPAQKPIMFLSNTKLNYQAMQDPATLHWLAECVANIAGSEDFANERGLVFVPSFKLGEQIITILNRKRLYRGKIYLHKSGEKIKDIVDKFKQHPRGGAILISPSIFEGVDFADDYSRFQIVTKAPYPSMGDARIKFIANNHSLYYNASTLQTIIQAFGRSIRNPEDFAHTFVLDGAVKQLFESKHNIWANQFTIME